ncbi:MAG: hypothetical protein JXA06_02680 [Bacteroidetes bacterium]|nr:hypothetical protein [Bacteroidota bacterium]
MIIDKKNKKLEINDKQVIEAMLKSIKSIHYLDAFNKTRVEFKKILKPFGNNLAKYIVNKNFNLKYFDREEESIIFKLCRDSLDYGKPSWVIGSLSSFELFWSPIKPRRELLIAITEKLLFLKGSPSLCKKCKQALINLNHKNKEVVFYKEKEICEYCYLKRKIELSKEGLASFFKDIKNYEHLKKPDTMDYFREFTDKVFSRDENAVKALKEYKNQIIDEYFLDCLYCSLYSLYHRNNDIRINGIKAIDTILEIIKEKGSKIIIKLLDENKPFVDINNPPHGCYTEMISNTRSHYWHVIFPLEKLLEAHGFSVKSKYIAIRDEGPPGYINHYHLFVFDDNKQCIKINEGNYFADKSL